MASKSQKLRKRTVSRTDQREDAIEPLTLQMRASQRSPSSNAFETVPFIASKTKRLLIEFVTVRAFIPTGKFLIGMLLISTGKAFVAHQLNISQVAFSNFDTLYAGSQLVLVYVDPGATIIFQFQLSAPSDAAVDVTFCGRFLRP
jgi:hypothetical protein